MCENKTSFDVVARAHREYLYRIACGLRVPPDDADDLVQDTLITGLLKWPTFEGRSTARVWLCGILIRLHWNHYRRSRNYQRRLDAYAAVVRQHEGHDHEPVLARRELQAFIATLDEKTGQVFVKFVLEGYKAREVADALGIPLSAVAWRLRRARLALAEYVEPRRSWAFLLGWNPWRSGPMGGLFEGFLSTAFVFGVMAIQLDDEEIIDQRIDQIVVEPPPALQLPADPPSAEPSAPPISTPDVAPTERKKPAARKRKVPPTIDYQAAVIQRVYEARLVGALDAPTCAFIMLEASTPVIIPPNLRSPRGSTGVGPWMDHVPNSGTLLEMSCQKMAITGNRAPP